MLTALLFRTTRPSAQSPRVLAGCETVLHSDQKD